MQLPSMAPASEPLPVEGPTVLSPFNPLQSSHKHMYTSSSKQHRLSQEGNISGKKPSKRASRRMSSTPNVEQPEATNVTRRASRLGMFGFFNRQKPEFEVAEPKLETQHEEEEDDKSQKQDVQDGISKTEGPENEHDLTPETTNPSTLDSLRHRASKRALKTKGSFTRGKSAPWEPPPLFQVYPQSVKHATLITPTPPSETIIRLAQERQSKQSEQSDGDVRGATKQHRDRRLHKSQAHELNSSRDWAEKVFVLVTEGYVLRYSGTGNHDRLPEKILPLCSVTAAFVTDVIPGKPYVLQIAQISNENGTINPEISRDTLKRANLKNEMKRAASAFLLVLEDPKEMNAWLVAVRREIMAFGGRVYRQEIFGSDGVEDDDDDDEQKDAPPHAIQRMPSERYLVKREPNRFSLKPPEVPTPPIEDSIHERGRAQASKGPALSPTNRYSLATTDSTNSRYKSDTTASIDQVHLDRLRESPRQSYVSIDAKTASTSRCSSMERSPVADRKTSDPSEAIFAQSSEASSVVHTVYRPTWSQTSGRDSQQTTPTPSSGRNVITPTVSRGPSPPTPNFSVPSFSKRFSVATNSSAQQESPKLPTVSDEGADHKCQAPAEGRPRSSGGPARQSPGAKQHNERLSANRRLSNSSKRPSSSGSDTRFSRRHSSLNYARGISPVPLAHHSLAPHPPPTTSLPPIPTQASPSHTPTVSPPKEPPPPPPKQQADVPAISKVSSSTVDPPKAEQTSLSAPHLPPISQATPPRKLRRPVSMQVRPRPPTPPNTNHAPQPEFSKIRFPFQDKPKPRRNSLKSSKQGRPPPLPSSPPPQPEVKAAAKAGGSIIRQDISSGSKNQDQKMIQDDGPVSPFHIPPIQLSDPRSRGSLDGPWNHDYGFPKRTYLDLTKG